MRVLLVHNWYGSSAPSGENVVVQAELDLLRTNGCEVDTYFKFSDTIRGQGLWGKIRGGIATPFNPFSYLEVRSRIRKVRPDVVHVHNFFPMISPAVFYAASHENTPIVMTLHNYRIGCAAGLPFRDFAVCTACLEDRSSGPSLKYKCYRNSLIATLPLASMIAAHRALKSWERHVDLFITLNEFQKDVLSASGLIPKNRCRTKSQFMSNPPDVVPWDQRLDRVIFVGRISHEKGVHVLLEAWEKWGSDAPELVVIGDGPVAEQLKSRYAKLNVSWLGQLPPRAVLDELGRSRLLVVPSICFEGFPMVIREAIACGVPTVASDIGPLRSIVHGLFGHLFLSGNADDLLSVMRKLWTSDLLMKKMALEARREFDMKFTAEENFDVLMGIYEEAIQLRREKKQSRR